MLLLVISFGSSCGRSAEQKAYEDSLLGVMNCTEKGIYTGEEKMFAADMYLATRPDQADMVKNVKARISREIALEKREEKQRDLDVLMGLPARLP